MLIDVIVVGSGYAGLYSALCAHRAGLSVVVLEKAGQAGGISICSAGGVRVAQDANSAFAYLAETCAGKTPDDVLRELAQGMCGLEAEIRKLAAEAGATVTYRRSPANYPFSGQDTFGFVVVEDVPGMEPRTRYPHVRGNRAGALLYALLEWHTHRCGISVRTGAPVASLLYNSNGVFGVQLESGETLEARRVILACGGFEANSAMQAQFWSGGPAHSAAYRHNTGDGIRMAMEVGADLWHMWHCHGSYGFAPRRGYPFGVRIKRLPDWSPSLSGVVEHDELPCMAWILLDRSGRRFMNEYEPYSHDTAIRSLANFDPQRMRYGRNPAWLVTDAPGLAMYPFGKPLYNDENTPDFAWTRDNQKEVEDGWFSRAETLPELAAVMDISPAHLQAEVNAWNGHCQTGQDPFGRPGSSMHPLLHAPFYVASMTPVVSNTHGGPRHNARQRVLHVRGHAIPGLYAAGDCGSAFGHLYMSGGNIAECFISGRIAATDDAG